MYYQVGQSVCIRCISSWNECNGDYQIIAYTKINDMKLIGVDIESTFLSKGQDELYNQFYDEDRLFYILKPITRINFEYIDTDGVNDKVKDFIYLCDDLIDYNNSEILTKRQQLNTLLYVGTFFKEELLDSDIEITGYHKDIQVNLKQDLSKILENYSSSYRIEIMNGDTILQPLSKALKDDQEFLDKRKQAELEAKQKLEEEQEKQNYLINKENFLLTKEKELNLIKAESINLQKELESKLKEVQKEKESVLASQNTLDKYESYLAQKEAKLNLRADKIRDRENELGISNSDL